MPRPFPFQLLHTVSESCAYIASAVRAAEEFERCCQVSGEIAGKQRKDGCNDPSTAAVPL